MTINQARKLIADSLVTLYSQQEAAAIGRRLLEDKFAVVPNDFILRGDSMMVDDSAVSECVERLMKCEPVQYVVGFEDFFGMRFSVSQATLIPRPETELLVRLILDNVEIDKQYQILDIGTGSGAIAVALAKNILHSKVSAIDISLDALKIAEKNSVDNGQNINFIHSDILTYTSAEKYDIIVSNPPYVTDSERELMRPNVLKYEPHKALFVPDNDPLRFYAAITQFAAANLNKEGLIFFEVNENFAPQTAQLLADNNFTNIQIHNDLNDKPRIVCARN